MPQLEELHDGAVYFLSGRRYQVYKLHLDDQNHTERRAIRHETHALLTRAYFYPVIIHITLER